MKTFVCLDTNILLGFVVQGKPGCEPEHWAKIKELSEGKRIQLLIPEVVAMELEKKYRRIGSRIEGIFKKIEHETNTAIESSFGSMRWDEVSSLKDALKAAVVEGYERWKTQWVADAEGRYGELKTFISSEVCQSLTFDQDIVFRTQRRKLMGQYPEHSSGSADFYIIDSLVKRFEEESGDCQLLFCTGNKKDFSLALESSTQRCIHPEFGDDLPKKNSIFLNLKDLAAFLEAEKSVEVPKQDVLEKAIQDEREKEIEEMIEEETLLEGDMPVGTVSFPNSVTTRGFRNDQLTNLREVLARDLSGNKMHFTT